MIRAIVVVLLLAGCALDGRTDLDAPDVGAAVPSAHEERDRAEIERLARELAQAYGRFGAVDDLSVSPDGKLVLVAVRDHPSTCLCDRERGIRDAGSMVAIIDRSGEGAPRVTRLFDHGPRARHLVAAGLRRLAVARRRTVLIWPRSGEGPPVEHRLPFTPRRLVWTPGGALLPLP